MKSWKKGLIPIGTLSVIFLVVIFLMNYEPNYTSIEVSPNKIKVEKESPSYIISNEFLKSSNEISEKYIQRLESEKEELLEELVIEKEKLLELDNIEGKLLELKDEVDNFYSYESDVLFTAGDFLQQESYEEAGVLYDILLKQDSDSKSLLDLKGITFALRGEHEQALEYFDKAIQSEEPRMFEWMEAMPYASKSHSLFALERYDEALESIDKAIEINPINARYLSLKAEMVGILGDNEGALFYFEKVLELYPDHVRALLGKATALSYLDREDESIFYYEKVLEIEPENVIAKRNLEILK